MKVFSGWLLLLIIPVFFAKGQLVRESSNPSAIQWTTRSIACNTLCISGDCEKGSVCTPSDLHRETYKVLNMQQAIVLKDKKFWLRASYRSYFLGTVKETRTLRLPEDEDDRLFFYILGKPVQLQPGKAGDAASLQRINSVPVSIKDLMGSGDLLLGKIPEDFPDTFEVGIESARWCSKLICDVWGPWHNLWKLEQRMAQLKYPLMPVMIDTLSVKQKDSFAEVKRITLRIAPENMNRVFLRNQLDSLNEPSFLISNAYFKVYPSMKEDPVKGKIKQQQSAATLAGILQSFPEGKQLKGKIEAGDGWTRFKQALRMSNLYYLADSGELYVRKRIASDPVLQRRLAPVIAECAMIVVELTLNFPTNMFNEEMYWQARMRMAVERKDYIAALRYQVPLIRRCKAGLVPVEVLVPPGIEPDPWSMSLFINKAAMRTDRVTQQAELERLKDIDGYNPLIKYNLLACQLNQIRSYQEDTLRDAMLFLLDAFHSINSTSIPEATYSILKSRFYYYINGNRRDRKLITYQDVASISRPIPADEAIKFADDFIHLYRYDIAYAILQDHYQDIPSSQPELIRQYAYRMLYYGNFMSNRISNDASSEIIRRLHSTDQHLIGELLNQHLISWYFLSIPAVRKMYQEALDRKSVV